MEKDNLNPNVYKKSENRKQTAADLDNNVTDPFDEREIFGMFVCYSILFLFSSIKRDKN